MILISSQMTSTCLNMIWQKIFNFTVEKLHLSADEQSQSCQLSHQGGDLSDKLGQWLSMQQKQIRFGNLSLLCSHLSMACPANGVLMSLSSNSRCNRSLRAPEEKLWKLLADSGVLSESVLSETFERAQIEQESVHTIYYIRGSVKL